MPLDAVAAMEAKTASSGLLAAAGVSVVTAQENVWLTLYVPSVAVTVTAYEPVAAAPAAMVPVIRPVAATDAEAGGQPRGAERECAAGRVAGLNLKGDRIPLGPRLIARRDHRHRVGHVPLERLAGAVARTVCIACRDEVGAVRGVAGLDRPGNQAVGGAGNRADVQTIRQSWRYPPTATAAATSRGGCRCRQPSRLPAPVG